MSSKRLILILGGKGGTGKTAFIALLYYFLATAHVQVRGYDADIENSDFFKSHNDEKYAVEQLDLLDVDEARDFLINLNKEKNRPDVLLIDMPGASGYETREVIDKFNFFRAAELLGYRITICSVLNTEESPIASLEAMMQPYGLQCDYVVVKPDVWAQEGKNFSIWENSETRQKFQALNGIEIQMPKLEPIVFQSLRQQKLSFFEIEALEFPDNLMAGSFLDFSKLQIDLAAQYLGLPTSTPEAAPEKPSKRSKRAETTVTEVQSG